VNEVTYRIVEHDGGWAYKVGDVFSETYAARRDAEAAAENAAAEQRVPGETETISWQDRDGVWHEEIESGADRPETNVERIAQPRRPRAPLRGGALALTLLLAGAVGVVLATLTSRRGPKRSG